MEEKKISQIEDVFDKLFDGSVKASKALELLENLLSECKTSEEKAKVFDQIGDYLDKQKNEKKLEDITGALLKAAKKPVKECWNKKLKGKKSALKGSAITRFEELYELVTILVAAKRRADVTTWVKNQEKSWKQLEKGVDSTERKLQLLLILTRRITKDHPVALPSVLNECPYEKLRQLVSQTLCKDGLLFNADHGEIITTILKQQAEHKKAKDTKSVDISFDIVHAELFKDKMENHHNELEWLLPFLNNLCLANFSDSLKPSNPKSVEFMIKVGVLLAGREEVQDSQIQKIRRFFNAAALKLHWKKEKADVETFGKVYEFLKENKAFFSRGAKKGDGPAHIDFLELGATQSLDDTLYQYILDKLLEEFGENTSKVKQLKETKVEKHLEELFSTNVFEEFKALIRTYDEKKGVGQKFKEKANNVVKCFQELRTRFPNVNMSDEMLFDRAMMFFNNCLPKHCINGGDDMDATLACFKELFDQFFTPLCGYLKKNKDDKLNPQDLSWEGFLRKHYESSVLKMPKAVVKKDSHSEGQASQLDSEDDGDNNNNNNNNENESELGSDKMKETLTKLFAEDAEIYDLISGYFGDAETTLDEIKEKLAKRANAIIEHLNKSKEGSADSNALDSKIFYGTLNFLYSCFECGIFNKKHEVDNVVRDLNALFEVMLAPIMASKSIHAGDSFPSQSNPNIVIRGSDFFNGLVSTHQFSLFHELYNRDTLLSSKWMTDTYVSELAKVIANKIYDWYWACDPGEDQDLKGNFQDYKNGLIFLHNHGLLVLHLKNGQFPEQDDDLRKVVERLGCQHRDGIMETLGIKEKVESVSEHEAEKSEENNDENNNNELEEKVGEKVGNDSSESSDSSSSDDKIMPEYYTKACKKAEEKLKHLAKLVSDQETKDEVEVKKYNHARVNLYNIHLQFKKEKHGLITRFRFWWRSIWARRAVKQFKRAEVRKDINDKVYREDWVEPGKPLPGYDVKKVLRKLSKYTKLTKNDKAEIKEIFSGDVANTYFDPKAKEIKHDKGYYQSRERLFDRLCCRDKLSPATNAVAVFLSDNSFYKQ